MSVEGDGHGSTQNLPEPRDVQHCRGTQIWLGRASSCSQDLDCVSDPRSMGNKEASSSWQLYGSHTLDRAQNTSFWGGDVQEDDFSTGRPW